MAYKRKERVGAIRSQRDLEDDALELYEKGYSFKGIGDLQGVSGSTAKDRVKTAKIRAAEAQISDQSSSKKVIPFAKEA